MENQVFSWIDYTLFVLMFLISAGIGIYYGFFVKQQNTTSAYLLGGKAMNYFTVAMSLSASMISSFSLLAFPTETYLYGTIYLVGVIAQILTGVILYYTFLPVFWKLEITAAYEYLEIRFDKTLRTVATVLYIVTNFIHLSFVIYAPSLAFSQVTGFNVYGIAIITCAVCIFYTSVGGLKAVVSADTLQLIVMLLTLTCIFVIGIVSSGGFGVILDKAELGERMNFFTMDLDPTARISFWSAAIGSVTTFTTFVATSPYTVQRFLAVKSLKESRKELIVFLVFHITLQLILCFSGIIMYAKYYDCDPLSTGHIKRADQILPYYVLDVATRVPGLSGLFIAGMFSASLSTLSTMLNSLSGLIYDLLSPIMPQDLTDRYTGHLLRIITILLGIMGIALVFVIGRLGTLLELLTSLYSVSLAPIGGMFLLGMLFPFSNTKGAYCGAIVSVVFMVFYNTKRQMHVWNGDIKYSHKPLYTHGCNMTSAVNTSLNTVETVAHQQSNVPWLFRLSFLYLVPMGCILTIIVGLLVSWLFYNKNVQAKPNTLCPCIRALLIKYRKASMCNGNNEICVRYSFRQEEKTES
ncbi:hypothetical protein ILUMI_19438 [Ignelater luminosus]|uniref:Sodium-coupled monocarboxylate transporter 1 n=1 Tax=Ignelater luminosus TaxID=2038154 RepID=A0A8K0CN29_IGNLU|nr:hypothetical protein ILUMI_19438 [Ignelater luminosus]